MSSSQQQQQQQQQQANDNAENRHRNDDDDDDDRPIEIFLHHDHQEDDDDEEDDDDDDFYTQMLAEATENNDNVDPPRQGQTTHQHHQEQQREDDDAFATANHPPHPEEFLPTTTADDFLVLTQQDQQEEEQDDQDANQGRTRTATATLQDDNGHEQQRQQEQEKEPTNKDQQVSQQQDDEEQVVPPRKITRNRRSSRAAQKGTTKTTTTTTTTGEHENNPYRGEDFSEKHGATKLIPRPRGRAKVGHVWDGVTGAWVPKDDKDDDDDDNDAGDTNDAATGSKAARSRSTSKRSLPMAGKTSAADDAKTTTTITPKPKRTKRTSLTTPTALEALPSPEMKAKHDQIVIIAREDLWNSDENVIVDALMKLSELCEPDDAESCRQLAFESGVHTLIVKLLERKTKAKELQERGLEVLFRISASSSPTIEKALLTMGSVEVAVKAMLKFPEHVDIQVYACVLLGNLTNTPGGWDAIQQSAIKVQAMSENASRQDNNKQGTEQDRQVQQGELPADRQSPTSSQLLAAVQVAQERHVDSEEMQEAAAFFLDRCLAIAGKPVLDLLVTTAPGSMHSLLLAKQTFGSNNASISRKVVSFFREVSTLC